MRPFASSSISSVILLASVIAVFSAPYRIGQRVEFRDDFHSYGGGWLKATITADSGPTAVEQFMVRIDGQRYDTVARFGQLRPADGSPAPPWPSTDPARMKQLNNYQPLEISGPATAGAASAEGSVSASSVPGAAPLQPAKTVPATRAAGIPDHAPSKSKFQNGEPMGVPSQTSFRLDRQGQKHLVAVAAPGTESYIGTWALKVGGAWTTKEVKDLGGGRRERVLEFGLPANSDVLTINADGTWTKQFAGKSSRGRWFDLGSNVVQLIRYSDDDDWTGSVQNGQMELRSPVGLWEYGRPAH